MAQVLFGTGMGYTDQFDPPVDAKAGGLPLTIFACAIPTTGAPSLRFLQGWVAMLRVLFDFVVDA